MLCIGIFVGASLDVGAITIVQFIFGALFLGLGCNIFLVLNLWCYALSSTSRRLAAAVAHLFYCNKMPSEMEVALLHKEHLGTSRII